MKKSCLSAVLVSLVMMCGCSNSDNAQNDYGSNYGVSPEYSVTKSALTGICKITIKPDGSAGKEIDMETDYLPNVTLCELGNSNYEALRMQTILGRTVAYYLLQYKNSLKGTTDDQVYSCPEYAPKGEQLAAQLEKMRQAVADTSGLVLYRNNTLLCTHYRSGCPTANLDSNCVWQGDPACPTHGQETQQRITYNWGKSGSDVKPSYGPGDPADSGCLSHNGAYCLSEKGWVYPNILKFFYGMDIEIRQAEGSCIDKLKCETQLNGAETIIDDRDRCFTRKVSDNYFTVGTIVKSGAAKVGYNDSLQFAYTTDKTASAEGTWRVNVKTPGTYQVFAYIDSNAGKLSKKAVYEVRADSENKKVTVDLNGSSQWLEIGKFKFAAGEDQWVKLTDATGEAYTDGNGTRVIYDALKFVFTGNCTDQCSKKGAKECHGNGYRTCDDSNADGCLEWSEDKACNTGDECRDGSCFTPEVKCENECEEGAAECVSNNGGFRKCGQFDADDCLEWSEVTNCDPGLVCSNAACIQNENLDCENECQDGQHKCGENGILTCGQFDDDECFEWSDTEEPCENDMVCKNGECVANSAPSEDTEKNVLPEDCLTEVDGKDTIIDELDDCFVQSDSPRWLKMNDTGYEDHIYYAYVRKDKESAVGTWYLNVTKSGTYKISAYISGGIGDVKNDIEYTVKAGKRFYHPVISVDAKTDGWVELGRYDLKDNAVQYIELTDKTNDADDEKNEMRVIFDAIRVQPDDGTSKDDDDEKKKEVKSSGSDCSMAGNAQNSFGLWMMLACFSGLMLLRRRKFSR